MSVFDTTLATVIARCPWSGPGERRWWKDVGDASVPLLVTVRPPIGVATTAGASGVPRRRDDQGSVPEGDDAVVGVVVVGTEPGKPLAQRPHLPVQRDLPLLQMPEAVGL